MTKQKLVPVEVALDALNRMQSILMMDNGEHPRNVLRAFINAAAPTSEPSELILCVARVLDEWPASSNTDNPDFENALAELELAYEACSDARVEPVDYLPPSDSRERAAAACPTGRLIVSGEKASTPFTVSAPASETSRVLLDSDSYCPSCGHNRDASSVSSIRHDDGTRSCQMCGSVWGEMKPAPSAAPGPGSPRAFFERHINGGYTPVSVSAPDEDGDCTICGLPWSDEKEPTELKVRLK